MTAQIRVSGVFLLFCEFRGNNQIYLSNSHDAVKSEFYDCVRVHSSSAQRQCQENGRKLHRFSKIQTKLFLFHYSYINGNLLSSKSKNTRVISKIRHLNSMDGSVNVFNKEYSERIVNINHPSGETLEKTLQWQLLMSTRNPEKVQIYGDVICYETLKCCVWIGEISVTDFNTLWKGRMKRIVIC